MNPIIPKGVLDKISNNIYDAQAYIYGSEKYPNAMGRVFFYQLSKGVLVATEVTGLPMDKGRCKNGVFGFHIHEGSSCTGTPTDPFADTGMHYNPWGCQHPDHAGDMPPLFGNDGFAWMMFYTDRFDVAEIVGRTVVIHSMPDDFRTQPSGNSGEKIACGVIERE